MFLQCHLQATHGDDYELNPHTIAWGVYEPIRVLIATGSRGHLPEDLLDGAREAFCDPRYFEVRVKLHPMRYNPAGRFLSRLREEWRHWVHFDRPYWRMLGVSAPGRLPAHWVFLISRGWRDRGYQTHLEWADVLVYDATSISTEATRQGIPIIHWLGRKQCWVYNPEAVEAKLKGVPLDTAEAGDPLVLRYLCYILGRDRALKRGAEKWDRSTDALIVKDGKRYDLC